jgi:hypothetical protein
MSVRSSGQGDQMLRAAATVPSGEGAFRLAHHGPMKECS